MHLFGGSYFIFGVCLTVLVTLTSAAKFCGKPPAAPKPGGKLKVSPSSRSNKRIKDGTSVKYSCKSNYELRGTKRRICTNGKWIPSEKKKTKCILIGCGHLPLTNAIASTSRPGPVYPFGTKATYSCKKDYNFTGSHILRCLETGKWSPLDNIPRCIDLYPCGPPPPAPQPGGTSCVTSDSRLKFPVGFRVNYTCPTGFGLDGVPYRICPKDGFWYPSARKHTCIKGLVTCPDPGIPDNGYIIVTSFAVNHMASFGCNTGYERKGSVWRMCTKSNAKNPFWDGQQTECIEIFENPDVLAARFRESFIDRTIACVRSNQTTIVPSSTIEPNLADTPRSACQGKTVVLGEGCVDLIFAVDTSLSVSVKGFNKSIDFVAIILRLFYLSLGTERVYFITYDVEVKVYIRFSNTITTAEALEIVKNAIFTGGSTFVNVAFDYIVDVILSEARNDCKIALFLLSDGQNNWGGNPETKATELKTTSNVEIYTIAIGESQKGWDSLKRIASGHDNFYAVREPGDIEKFARKAVEVPLEYGKQCGRTAVKEKKCRDQLDDHCRSSLGAWPWMVGIYALGKGKNKKETMICGGALIGNCHVLTAAHCLKPDNNTAYKKDDVLVVVGNTDRLVDEKTEDTHKVDEILIHPSYSPITLDYDIAILKLSCNVSYNHYVRKVCMPDCNKTTDLYKTGKKCTAAGWGATDYQEGEAFHLSTHLHHIELPVADKEACKELSEYPITPRMFCAGDASGEKGVCKGDSGGPLFCKTESELGWVLTGVVSWGEGCKRARKYDIFTNVCNNEINSWIDEKIEKHSCRFCVDESDCSCQDRPSINVV
ncbi:complement factor B-like [Corticium candelabrum]|uniref:complement factor B-like n=1 Tax=Corticium candelabrum TaxID=121492 RepID=UPI002E25ED79|nr:complement factor B-like [Corticium candelabrum]